MNVSRIRVLQITSRLNVGGLAQLVLDICDGLDSSRFECMLATGCLAPGEGDMLQFRSPPSVPMTVIPELGRSPSAWKDGVALAKLAFLIRRFKPHIVNTHAAKAGILGRLSSLGAGCVRVHCFHGNVFDGYFSSWVSRVIVGAERLFANRTQALVVPSRQQQIELVDRYRIAELEKVRVLPYGIAVEQYENLPSRREARRALGVPQEALIVGAVGRMAPVKNHGLLLEAFDKLSQEPRFQNLHLLLVGDGECRFEIEEFVRRMKEGHKVKIIGWLKDLTMAYSALDVLALTSRNEGMPIAVMEAMASGLPVVSTPAGGVVDLIENGKTGWVTTTHGKAEFTQMLSSVLENLEKARQAGACAKSHVRREHSRQAYLRRLEELYLGLVK